jgi:hypothetical protein
MVGLAGAPVASARLAPQKTPQPATSSGLPALLAVRKPAQPARLGVAVKQPPVVRLSILGFGRVSLAVRHSILPAADGRRHPPAWRLGTPGGRRIRATNRRRGIAAAGGADQVLPRPRRARQYPS